MRLFLCLSYWLIAAASLCLCVTMQPALAATRALLTPVPSQVTVADGLPSDTVSELAEDQQGYLWIASDD
ncbi:MAG: hypothetical protein EOO80_16190, partial [Oxalobacteraceae bacterium]